MNVRWNYCDHSLSQFIRFRKSLLSTLSDSCRSRSHGHEHKSLERKSLSNSNKKTETSFMSHSSSYRPRKLWLPLSKRWAFGSLWLEEYNQNVRTLRFVILWITKSLRFKIMFVIYFFASLSWCAETKINVVKFEIEHWDLIQWEHLFSLQPVRSPTPAQVRHGVTTTSRESSQLITIREKHLWDLSTQGNSVSVMTTSGDMPSLTHILWFSRFKDINNSVMIECRS